MHQGLIHVGVCVCVCARVSVSVRFGLRFQGSACLVGVCVSLFGCELG